MKCFFCDIQLDDNDPNKLLENNLFFSRFDDFPVSEGHAEIIPKVHKKSFFELSTDEVGELHKLLVETKNKIDSQFKPDGYTLGVNDGEAAGQTIDHLHVHLIPRYDGDVENPRGGIRNIIPGRGDYSQDAKKINRDHYLK